VVVPAARSCCGQLTLNFGDSRKAKSIVRQVIVAFAKVDYIVIPSVFCFATLKLHYAELFADEPEMADAVNSMVARTWEYFSFLEVMCWPDKNARRLFALVVEGYCDDGFDRLRWS
jgi:L-lactate dehydrogenase complex protein LldE